MKIKLLLIALLVSVLALAVGAQSISSAVYIWKVYSENGQYFLQSIPWDNESPSLRGTTSVYRKEGGSPIYSFNLGFDDAGKNRLVLSNNGEIIFYVIPWMADETRDGLKSISIYKKGQLSRSFTEHELTGCDDKKEHCRLLYSNYDDVVDQEKTRAAHRVVFKEDVSVDERFLFEHPIVSSKDTVYLIDPKKKVHKFDLNEATYLGAVTLDSVFGIIRSEVHTNKVESERFEAPVFLNFPRLRSGKDTYKALASSLGMKVYDDRSTKDEVYKEYRFKLNGYLQQDGSIEVEDIEIFDDLPKDKIIGFFTSNRFVSSDIPSVFEKWHIPDAYFHFRKANNGLARRERLLELSKEREAHKKRLIAERIGDRYIPVNLGDCVSELDKLLSEVDKNDMLALKERDDMIQYHMGLGMWMRNHWGLWGGSRLQKYFTDRGVSHPDYMSGIILDHYWDWLHGNKDSWREWEKKNLPTIIIPNRSPSALLNFAIPKWNADKNIRIEDVYKWLYQATRGGEHAVPDEESARKWLDDEWKTLAKPDAHEPIWEPLCIGGEIGRLNLRPFKTNGGKTDDLLKAFLASSREFGTRQTSFVDAWYELGKRLKKRSIGRLTYTSWAELSAEMESKDYPAIHHSETYEKANHPAYRILTSAEMKKLLTH